MDRVLAALPWRQAAFYELSLRRRVVLTQLPLAITALLPFVDLAVFHTAVLADPLVQWAGWLLMILTVACVLVPWERLPYSSFLVIPVLNFVPIGLLRHGAGEALVGVSLLAVFPVIWLAASGRWPRLAVPLGVLLSLAMVWVPLFLPSTPLTLELLVAPLLLPLMMLGVGVTVQSLDRSMEKQKAGLQAQKEQLEAQQAVLEAKDVELRRSLAESARRQRLLDAVLEAVDVGVLAIDVEGHDILMNRRQQAIHRLGLPTGTDDAPEAQLLLFGPDGTSSLPPQARPAARAVRGESFSNELIRIGPAPDQRVLSVSTRIMTDEHRIREGTVLSFTDVTELVGALQAKDDFLAGVSHELRTPLTSIRGYTELMTMAEDLSGPVREAMAVIERNADQLLVLVEDLLSTSIRRPSTQRASLDLVHLVEQSLAAAGPTAAAAGVDLQAQLPASLVMDGDPVRIGQVLDNLVSNAIKYSPAGGPVTVRLTEGGEGARLQVADRGIGMHPEETKEVFGRFTRSANARMSTIPGLGLGLAVVKDIVEDHQGTITCDSALGEGTVFTITLPQASPLASRPA